MLLVFHLFQKRIVQVEMEEQSASESQVPCTPPMKPCTAAQDTPKSTAKKTRKAAEIFGLGKGVTVNMFDTTASNTGHVTAA